MLTITWKRLSKHEGGMQTQLGGRNTRGRGGGMTGVSMDTEVVLEEANYLQAWGGRV